MALTDEEAIERGKNLVEAYYRHNYSADYAREKRDEVYRRSHNWAMQAVYLDEMGYTLIASGATTINGRQVTGDALLRTVEQLLENVKTTLEALEKQADQPANKKLITQWRFVLNALQGAPHKRGLLPDLKEAGPGAY